jgi:hypothetical protein
LLPDPLEHLKPVDKSLILGFENDHKTKVFITLLQQIFMHFNALEEKKIRQFLIDNLAKIDADNRHIVQMQEWLLEKAATLDANYDIGDMQKLIHFAYVAMCELFGPVKADQYLAQAVEDTENFAQKLNIKIHDLL